MIDWLGPKWQIKCWWSHSWKFRIRGFNIGNLIWRALYLEIFPSSLWRQNSSINLISVFLITWQWLDMSYSGLWVLKSCRLRSFKILFASESFSFFTALKRPSKDTSFFGHFSIVYYRLWLWLRGFPYDKLFLGKKVIYWSTFCLSYRKAANSRLSWLVAHLVDQNHATLFLPGQIIFHYFCSWYSG